MSIGVLMEPIPETVEAVEEYGPFDDLDLLQVLRDWAEQVREVVPACVGISLASLDHGVSFTVVATDKEIASLDGVQYLHGGPCVDGVLAERVLHYTDEDLLDEAEWQLFAQATAAAGIRSTLTLPILSASEVVGSVNLYAATADAFIGHHQAVAEIFGAWVPGAVANADLGFRTRVRAEQAPRVLREQMRIQIAVGVLMEQTDIGEEAALAKLHDAALRSGVTVTALAERIIAQAAGGGRTSDDRDG